jgi:hypothetical protein
MDADFSIELGHEDPVLDFPWNDPSGKLAYLDVKRHPKFLDQIEEAEEFPELKEFLSVLNSSRSMLETAKCDAWVTMDLSSEEEIYEATHKFASYVDVVFAENDGDLSDGGRPSIRQSFPAHEQLARELVELLRRAPVMLSSAEVCVRRCHFARTGSIQEGFYCTIYLSGYGSDEPSARQHWGVALKLMANAIRQLSASNML